jgi:hypothetical protein
MLNPNLDEIQLNKQEYERYSPPHPAVDFGNEGPKAAKCTPRVGTEDSVPRHSYSI